MGVTKRLLLAGKPLIGDRVAAVVSSAIARSQGVSMMQEMRDLFVGSSSGVMTPGGRT